MQALYNLSKRQREIPNLKRGVPIRPRDTTDGLSITSSNATPTVSPARLGLPEPTPQAVTPDWVVKPTPIKQPARVQQAKQETTRKKNIAELWKTDNLWKTLETVKQNIATAKKVTQSNNVPPKTTKPTLESAKKVAVNKKDTRDFDDLLEWTDEVEAYKKIADHIAKTDDYIQKLDSYKSRIETLEWIQSRVWKVGKNKVNRQYANKQSLEFEKKKNSLLESMVEDLGIDQFQASDLYDDIVYNG